MQRFFLRGLALIPLLSAANRVFSILETDGCFCDSARINW
jgi:hypothetical protein